jgi:hypothetical protein
MPIQEIFGILIAVIIYGLLWQKIIAKCSPRYKSLMVFILIAGTTIYLVLYFWIQFVYLDGRQFWGDSDGYHLGAIRSAQMFKHLHFRISPSVAGSNDVGYPAYFLAPIYIISNYHSEIAILFQMILSFHIALRIRDIVFLSIKNERAANMAFTFAFIFPDMLCLAQYIRKDIVILWCIVNIFYYATQFRETRKLSIKSIIMIVLFTGYGFFFRGNYLLMATTSSLIFITLRSTSRFWRGLRVISSVVIIIFIYNEINSFLNSKISATQFDYFKKTTFAGARTPKDIALATIKRPVPSSIYFLKVFQATFVGSLSGIRMFMSPPALVKEHLGIEWIANGISGFWRYPNGIFTFIGLWIILRRYLSQFFHILLFTLSLMLILYSVGYSGRYGLPGMIINSICWGVGIGYVIDRQKAKLRRRSARAAIWATQTPTMPKPATNLLHG